MPEKLQVPCSSAHFVHVTPLTVTEAGLLAACAAEKKVSEKSINKKYLICLIDFVPIDLKLFTDEKEEPIASTLDADDVNIRRSIPPDTYAQGPSHVEPARQTRQPY